MSLRIIAGEWRSRRLESAGGPATRPTASRVREALFSMLQSRLGSFEDLLVLDLFAGSGALALESLSRGAGRALLVERDPKSIRAIEHNIRALSANARLLGFDATRLPVASAAADLVFLDPPYGQGLLPLALAEARRRGWLLPHTWIAAESAATEQPDFPDCHVVLSRTIGKAQLWLLRPNGGTPPLPA